MPLLLEERREEKSVPGVSAVLGTGAFADSLAVGRRQPGQAGSSLMAFWARGGGQRG